MPCHRNIALRLIADPATGELRPWAVTLLAARRRLWRWWYFRALPRAIGARAQLRYWCGASPIGCALTTPMPPVLANIALAALSWLASVALLCALALVSQYHCERFPCSSWECRKWLAESGRIDWAAYRALGKSCRKEDEEQK